MVICEKCKRIMKIVDPEKDFGVAVIENDEKQKPYRIWYGDRLTCPKCGITTVSRFGDPTPRHSEYFQTTVNALKANMEKIPYSVLEVK